MLALPQWAYDLSPIEHVRSPVADVSVRPLLALTATAAALTAIGLAGVRRRDVGPA